MPYKKRTYKKRKPYRRRRRYKSYPRKSLGGFPSSRMVKLKYCQEIALNPGLGAIAQHQFRCNSVYDPDYSGAGHQPMNFDRWSAMYDHYTVMGAKCNIRPILTTVANVNPCYAGIFISTDSAGTSSFTNVTSLFENRLTSHKWILSGGADSTSRNPQAWGVNSYFSGKKLFGVKNLNDGAAYGALVTSNPTRDAYFNVYAASMNGNDPGLVNFLVTIEYIVLFSEAVTQTQN